jgi:hypothetical protein
MVQLDDNASKEVHGVPEVGATIANRLAFVPLIDAAMLRELAVLTFVTSKFNVLELVCETLPNARVVGTNASTAMPESCSSCGLLGSLSSIAIVPVIVPARSEVFGENNTLIMQLAFCASDTIVEPQVVPVATVKSLLLGAPTEMPVTVTVPVFFTVTVTALLEVVPSS